MDKGLDKLDSHMKRRELANAPRYVVRSAKWILEHKPKPLVEIWGGMTQSNDIFELIGASGIGKSRILLNLAVMQCLADSKPADEATFAGLPLYRGELKWLMLGTENGINRLYDDLAAMTKFCTQEQLDLLDRRLLMTTLEGDGDSYMAMDNDDNRAKLKTTLELYEPDIVTFDPWGDICGGSELDDNIVRATVQEIRKLRPNAKKTMPILIVNHARMGSEENAKGLGLDAGNFGKNSKALFTISRCVWNLMYASQDTSQGRVLMHNAKRSNGKKYENRIIQLQPEYLTYTYEAEANVDQTVAEMTVDSTGPRQNRLSERVAWNEAIIRIGVEAALEELKKGPLPKTDLKSIISGAGVPYRKVADVISKLEREHQIESVRQRGRNGSIMYGKREDIAKIIDENAR